MKIMGFSRGSDGIKNLLIMQNLKTEKNIFPCDENSGFTLNLFHKKIEQWQLYLSCCILNPYYLFIFN